MDIWLNKLWNQKVLLLHTAIHPKHKSRKILYHIDALSHLTLNYIFQRQIALWIPETVLMFYLKEKVITLIFLKTKPDL